MAGTADVVLFSPIEEDIAPTSILSHAPEIPGIIKVNLNGEFLAYGVLRQLIRHPITGLLGIRRGTLYDE